MPSSYLLDTNAVSDLMLDHPKLTARAAAVAPALLTSVIVRGEVYFGIERLPHGKRRKQLKTKADKVLGTLRVELVTEPIADRYAVIRHAMEAMGMAMNGNDLWIAATALEIGATLVSRDKGFQHVPGLTVEDWTV